MVPSVEGPVWGGWWPNSGRGRHASAWWRMMCHVREGVGSGVGNWSDANIKRVVGNGRNIFFWTDNWLGGAPLKIQFSHLYELSVHKNYTVEEMTSLGRGEGGNAWGWRRRLLAWEEGSVRECFVLLNNIILQDHIQDLWRWMLDPIHGYSVRGTYRFPTSAIEPVMANVITMFCIN